MIEEEKPRKTIGIKEYESTPFVYDDDGNINMLRLKVGDMYRMRDNGKINDIGDRVTLYKVLRITPNGDESTMITLTIE
jgi:hypothetical protein